MERIDTLEGQLSDLEGQQSKGYIDPEKTNKYGSGKAQNLKDKEIIEYLGE